MNEEVASLAKELSSKLGNLVGVRVYITITDQNGNSVFNDTSLEVHKDFIQNFVKNNFNYLNIGDHSIPLSNKNIIFFKTTDSSVAVLHNPKGKIGQLLLFRKIMEDYTDLMKDTLNFNDNVQVKPVEEVPEEVLIPQTKIISPIVSKKEKFLDTIYPFFNKKAKIKEKFTFNESNILRKIDENNSINNIFKGLDIDEMEIMDAIYKFKQKGLIGFFKHEILKISCAECNKYCYRLIPRYLTKKDREKVRFQIFPEGCEHTCITFLDKKDKFITKKIEKLMSSKDEQDFTNLTIRDLISFLGQDLFFNIFHSLFYQTPIIFIGEDIESHIKEMAQFFERIFPNIEYGNSINNITSDDYEKNRKQYENHLIIDFDSNIAKDPYKEKEHFIFEEKLFHKILKLENDNMQILGANAEFEELIINTDMILNELRGISEISEDNLIKKMKEDYELIIDHSEIPIIMKIAEIYYETDVSKKIKRTVTGKMSDFFDIVDII